MQWMVLRQTRTYSKLHNNLLSLHVADWNCHSHSFTAFSRVLTGPHGPGCRVCLGAIDIRLDFSGSEASRLSRACQRVVWLLWCSDAWHPKKLSYPFTIITPSFTYIISTDWPIWDPLRPMMCSAMFAPWCNDAPAGSSRIQPAAPSAGPPSWGPWTLPKAPLLCQALPPWTWVEV